MELTQTEASFKSDVNELITLPRVSFHSETEKEVTGYSFMLEGTPQKVMLCFSVFRSKNYHAVDYQYVDLDPDTIYDVNLFAGVKGRDFTLRVISYSDNPGIVVKSFFPR